MMWNSIILSLLLLFFSSTGGSAKRFVEEVNSQEQGITAGNLPMMLYVNGASQEGTGSLDTVAAVSGVEQATFPDTNRYAEVRETEDAGAFVEAPLAQMKEVYMSLRPLVHRYGWYVLALLFLIVIMAMVRKHKKKAKRKHPPLLPDPAPTVASHQGDIVVRRKTTTILRKQNLGDVLHNDNYMRIDCQDFCNDSAVRRIYIKNTCIKEIYNMYSDDLRSPDNPKEDGCMVLGRWVYDDEADEYYVSLEYVVLPGDDAVFKEYELNFGGKIKLRVREKLRRLRTDTDLQYDMTCWVHSHPGLGVFFSNSDNGVHMQLKHPTHPKFLTAMVVDILTPQMDLGIFTFKQGGELTVNSKQDLTRLFSLEKMYKWALESDRSAFRQEDNYNMLSSAQMRDESCNGILLSNSAVIDISRCLEDRGPEGVLFAYGFPHTHGIYTEYVVEEVSSKKELTNHELVGCLVSGTHLSLPTIRKSIEDKKDKCSFVLFYSTVKGDLISLPVFKGEILEDDKYFGEVKMEDLKIWTRRRR